MTRMNRRKITGENEQSIRLGRGRSLPDVKENDETDEKRRVTGRNEERFREWGCIPFSWKEAHCVRLHILQWNAHPGLCVPPPWAPPGASWGLRERSGVQKALPMLKMVFQEGKIEIEIVLEMKAKIETR